MNIYPQRIADNTFNSKAESKVYYHAMKDESFEGNNDRFLFYSVKNPTPGDNRLMGETDFIYLDKKVMLFIEVKGGQVKYDLASNQWWVIGGTEKGDPFAQAANNLFNFRDRKIISLFRGDRSVINRLIFGYAVFFPDCLKPKSFNKLSKNNVEYDPELIFDFNNFENQSFNSIINKLAFYWENHEKYSTRTYLGLSSKELFQIKNYIRHDIVFELPWINLLSDNENKILKYTEEQSSILDILDYNPGRGGIIIGGPGTGKTWMAIEQAKKIDILGKRVLYLCFNKNLSYLISKQFAVLKTNNVSIFYLHEFYSSFIKAHFQLEISELMEEFGSEKFWHKSLPLKFSELFTNYFFEKYDYLILDECQDYFNEYHIDAIDLLIHGGFNSGQFLICMDSKYQDFYLDFDSDFMAYFKDIYPVNILPLVKNCRNPQKLVDQAYDLTGLVRQDCYLKETVQSSMVVYFNTIEELKSRILSFVDQKRLEKIPVERITILCFDIEVRNLVLSFDNESFISISENNLFQENRIMVATAQAYKGLENQFILYIGPQNFVIDNPKQLKVSFNAFTRAKVQFIFYLNLKYQQVLDNLSITNSINSIT